MPLAVFDPPQAWIARAGRCGSTWSVRWAATSHMRRALHEGPMPRLLHENGISRSWPPSSQAGPGEAVGQNAALEVAPEVTLDPLGQ